MSEKVIMERTYSGEDYIDAAQHIDEAMENMPTDDDGFGVGTFRVVVYHDMGAV